MQQLQTPIKIILAILLLLCLLHMPYSFYTLVRFLSFVGFSIIAYHHYQKQEENLAILFASFVILFQPFFKISLGRTVWNIIDVAVAIFLLVLVFTNKIEK
jgi:hypothetical protein